FCPFHIARSELSGADIIVANHSLVAMDLQLGGGVLLPSVDEAVYVFDEAHRMPDIVRDATASTMSLSSTLSVLESLNKLADKRKLTAALSPSLSQRISDEIKVNANDLIKSLRALQDFVATNEEVLFHGSQFHRFELGTIPNVFESLLLDVQTSTKAVRRTLGKTGNHLKAEIIDEGSNLVAEKGLSDLSFFIGRIDLVWTTTNLLMTHHTAGIQPAKWLERRDGKLYLAASEVSVGNSLLSWLWKKNSGVILTSATLRSLSVFDTYLSSTGLNLANHAAVFCRVYESPFDYQSQAKLIMPINLPFEPNDAEYVTWLKHIMFNLIKGEPSSLVIFTSHAQMQAVRTAVEHSCTTSKILLQCQGDASRQAILENHAKAIEQGLRSVLFGVNSMAEGLDLRGDLLTNLIIVRLPFEMPESPIAAAHMEYEKYLGNNAFYTVTLPKASIALIQSVGRLIRSENDSGKCTILDKRIQTKNYGEDLLCSLPPMSREYRQVT
ncbi:helicase C-terminal domain-containing protein, partial [Vibrio thalassae]